MRKFIMAQLALIAIGAFGATNESERCSPVMYWNDSVSYAQDEIIDGLREQVETANEGASSIDETVSGTKSDTSQRTTTGAKIEMQVDASKSLVGMSAKAAVHAEAFAETKFDWEKKRIEQAKARQERWNKTEQSVKERVKLHKGDWKLRLNVNFVNRPDGPVLQYKQCKEVTGVFLKIIGDENKVYRIPVSPEELEPTEFELRPGGKETFTM